MNRKLRFAIIGFGGIGHFHAACYAEQKQAELVAVCDTDPAQFGKKSQSINIGSSGETNLKEIKTFLSYEEMVKNVSFDALDICLPCHLHKEYAVKAMKDGFHVLCEKPMARTLAQADQMIRTSRETGRRLMIAQCLRFSPAFQKLKELVENKKYGSLLRLDMRRNSSLPSRKWYHDPAKSGGALLDLHLHDTDLVNFIFGTPSAVQTWGIVRDTGGIDDLMTNYIFPGGPVINAEGSWCKGVWFSSHIAVFEKATVEFSKTEIKIYVPGREMELFPVPGPNHYAREIAYFAECILAGKPFDLALPESTRESIRIALAEERSARKNGKKVSLSS